MTDIALYRTVESVSGRIEKLFPAEEDGLRRVEILLDRPVSTVLKVEVNRRASPEVIQYGERRITAAIPLELSNLALDLLAFSVVVEISFDQINQTPVPSLVGIGLRPSTIDRESQALQTAVRSLLMSPGSDSWDRSRGGGLRQLRNVLVSEDDLSRVTRVIQVALDRYNSQASKLTSFGRSRVSSVRRPPTHRVTNIELQFVKFMQREQAERTLGLLTGVATNQSVLRENVDPTDRVIAISLLVTLRGPRGETTDVSTAVSI